MVDQEREEAIGHYKKVLNDTRKMEDKIKKLREAISSKIEEVQKTEEQMKSLQSVGQIIGELLRPLSDEKCKRERDLLSQNISTSLSSFSNLVNLSSQLSSKRQMALDMSLAAEIRLIVLSC